MALDAEAKKTLLRKLEKYNINARDYRDN